MVYSLNSEKGLGAIFMIKKWHIQDWEHLWGTGFHLLDPGQHFLPPWSVGF
jgi:hypothetical protein